MAAYPSFPQLIEGAEDGWVDDLVFDRAVNGDLKVRAFYPGKKRTFKVPHVLNRVDFATLEAFYDTNRLLAVEFTWVRDGQTYTCMFGGPPQIVHIDRYRSRVTSLLLEQ